MSSNEDNYKRCTVYIEKYKDSLKYDCFYDREVFTLNDNLMISILLYNPDKDSVLWNGHKIPMDKDRTRLICTSVLILDKETRNSKYVDNTLDEFYKLPTE